LIRHLVALDLDGTSLTTDHELAPGLVDVVHKLREAGVESVIVTGRMMPSAHHFAKELGITLPCGTMNGVLVSDPGPALHSAALEPALVDHLVDRTMTGPIQPTVFTRDAIYLPERAVENQRMLSLFGHQADYRIQTRPVPPEPAYQLHYLGPQTDLDDLKHALIDEGRCDPEGFFGYGSLVSGWAHLEYKVPGENKGTALRHIRKHLDLTRDQVTAVGDWVNDLPAFEEAGTAVAVGSAAPAAKDRADVVLDGDNNTGDLAAWLAGLL